VHVEKGSTGALSRLLLDVMTVMGRGGGGAEGMTWEAVSLLQASEGCCGMSDG
jgi:hypothetical protein